MTEDQSSPLFANRYRFQTVGSDWDRGRSGLTHLVFDIKKERLGVIKRAEIKSQQAVENLKNEVAALLDLKGEGVPEVYDTGEAEYGSKNYFYVVLEYIDGIRVEKNLASLTAVERTEILTQFFGVLAKSHQMGIVNGDVDLKHLFWRKDKKQLIVIDWGNAKLDVDRKEKKEFAYDLARSAEIIYALVTKQGRVPSTGTIVLPDKSKLIPDLSPLPVEFQNLCKWAPRTPTDGAQSPYTMLELLDVAQNWQKVLQKAKSQTKRPKWGLIIFFVLVIAVIAIFLGIWLGSPLYALINPKTSTPTQIADTALPTITETIKSETPSPIITPTITFTATAESSNTPTPTFHVEPTFTATTAITPTPRTLTTESMVKEFNTGSSLSACWISETNFPSNDGLKVNEAFYERDDKNWGFRLGQGRAVDQFALSDFQPCFSNKQVEALALNAWIPRLELERDSPDNPGTADPGNELGIFIESATGKRREYTFWVDQTKLMHLRVREDKNIIFDEAVLIVNTANFKIKGTFPRLSADFPIQVFLDINNQGSDIIYLGEGTLQKPATVQDLIPARMQRQDKAVFQTLGEIKRIGLIGYGGETQVVIWPLVFFGK